MTYQSDRPISAMAAGPAEQVKQLFHIVGLVDEIAGRDHGAPCPWNGAQLEAAYAVALPLDRRRFDRLIAEIAVQAGAGVSALLALEDRGVRPRTAAARLADELVCSLKALHRILPVRV